MQLSTACLSVGLTVRNLDEEPKSHHAITFDEGAGVLSLEMTTTKEDTNEMKVVEVEKVWSL